MNRFARPGIVPLRTHRTSSSLSADPEATRKRIRRCKAIRNELLKDRGGDPTRAQAILAENAAGLAVWLEEQMRDALSGKEFKGAELTTAINTLNRLLFLTLGITRVPKNVLAIENYIEGIAKRANGSAPKEITIEATNPTTQRTD